LALFKEEKTLISHNFKKDESVAKGRLEVALLNQDSHKLLMGIQLILQTMIVLSERAKLVEECLHNQRKNQLRLEMVIEILVKIAMVQSITVKKGAIKMI
jgi:hypothetical protein